MCVWREESFIGWRPLFRLSLIFLVHPCFSFPPSFIITFITFSWLRMVNVIIRWGVSDWNSAIDFRFSRIKWEEILGNKLVPIWEIDIFWKEFDRLTLSTKVYKFFKFSKIFKFFKFFQKRFQVFPKSFQVFRKVFKFYKFF